MLVGFYLVYVNLIEAGLDKLNRRAYIISACILREPPYFGVMLRSLLCTLLSSFYGISMCLAVANTGSVDKQKWFYEVNLLFVYMNCVSLKFYFMARSSMELNITHTYYQRT